jgi:hypothetical protein
MNEELFIVKDNSCFMELVGWLVGWFGWLVGWLVG